MSEFPYTTVAGKLKSFLDRIAETGVPAKLSQQELAARGFKSTNDRSILTVLKAVGLIGLDGVPTKNWQAYRDRSTNKALMGQLVKKAYAPLYDVYPDAHNRSDTDIKNWLGSKTKAGDRVLSYMVQTFKVLVGMSDFSAQCTVIPDIEEAGVSPTISSSSKYLVPTAPQVHVNLQVHVPDQADANQIDLIFKSMAKHIFGRVADE